MALADTAAELGCAEGTVRSQESRGLARLRAVYPVGADLAAAEAAPSTGNAW